MYTSRTQSDLNTVAKPHCNSSPFKNLTCFMVQPQQGSQPKYPSQLSPQPYSTQPQFSPSLSEPAYPAPQKFEPPPSTITLRQQQPVHQKPPPVFASQPATASYKGKRFLMKRKEKQMTCYLHTFCDVSNSVKNTNIHISLST